MRENLTVTAHCVTLHLPDIPCGCLRFCCQKCMPLWIFPHLSWHFIERPSLIFSVRNILRIRMYKVFFLILKLQLMYLEKNSEKFCFLLFPVDKQDRIWGKAKRRRRRWVEKQIHSRWFYQWDRRELQADSLLQHHRCPHPHGHIRRLWVGTFSLLFSRKCWVLSVYGQLL